MQRHFSIGLLASIPLFFAACSDLPSGISTLSNATLSARSAIAPPSKGNTSPPDSLKATPLEHDTDTSAPEHSPLLHEWNEAITHSAVIGASFGAKPRLGMIGLPKNSRQTNEGYWLGSRPDIEELEELHARNIQLILTVSTLPRRELKNLKDSLQALGMTHIYLPFGSKFPHPSRFMPTVMKFQPEQIFIHCEHGSDRTGAVLAFILTVRHNWPLPKALFAVVLPSSSDIRTLANILKSHGYQFDLDEMKQVIGIYSAEENGGYGGMKVRSDGGNYINLIHTLIRRAQNASEQKE